MTALGRFLRRRWCRRCAVFTGVFLIAMVV